MKKIPLSILVLTLLFILASRVVHSASNKLPVTKYSWGNIPVYFIEDNRFPTFHVVYYFGDGAAADDPSLAGLTALTLDQLTSGTSQYSQRQIADMVDRYGMSVSSYVTHEYSQFSVSGLMDQFEESHKLVCHMFRQATFPQGEVRSASERISAQLKNLVASPGELANRVFRGLKFQNTDLAYPVEGSLRSLMNIKSEKLRERLNVISDKSYKRIYILGPRTALKLEDIIAKECKWAEQGKIKSVDALAKKLPQSKVEGGKIYFSELPGANQAQLRIGLMHSKEQYPKDYDLANFSNGVLGGSFTALLMQEVRVRLGLTYSIYSSTAAQATYGRSMIVTSTKNDGVLGAVQAINNVLEKVKNKKVEAELIERSRRFFSGKHMLQLESPQSLMQAVISFHHQGRNPTEILDFPKRLPKFKDTQVLNTLVKLYDLEQMIYYVQGDKQVLKSLEKANIMPIEVVHYRQFL